MDSPKSVRLTIFLKPSTFEALQAVATAMGKTEARVAAEFLAEAERGLHSLAKGVEKVNSRMRDRLGGRQAA